MVVTRSQKKASRPIYEVNIDFDEASFLWKENKKYNKNNGLYVYICSAISKNGNKCKSKCVFNEEFCKLHCKK